MGWICSKDGEKGMYTEFWRGNPFQNVHLKGRGDGQVTLRWNLDRWCPKVMTNDDVESSGSATKDLIVKIFK